MQYARYNSLNAKYKVFYFWFSPLTGRDLLVISRGLGIWSLLYFCPLGGSWGQSGSHACKQRVKSPRAFGETAGDVIWAISGQSQVCNFTSTNITFQCQ